MHRPGRRRRLLAVGAALLLLASAAVVFPDLIGRLVPPLLYFPERLDPEARQPVGWGLSGAEEVRLETADRFVLHGWWVRASGHGAAEHSAAEHGTAEHAAAGRGAAIFFHGNAGHLGYRAPIAADLARLGLDVLLFDYRGYGLSEGRPREEGLYLDAAAAYLHVRDVRGVDPARILLIGHSLGGAVAAWTASEYPAAGLVVTGTFRSVPQMARRLHPWIPWRLLRWKRNRFDAESRIAGARMPVLVGRGGADELIPREETRALFEAAPEPKRWREIPGAGHNDLWSHPEMWRELEIFVEETLGPRLYGKEEGAK
ncbi:MAG: alpha/beta hydrolase [Gemmatimonadota bacterium]